MVCKIFVHSVALVLMAAGASAQNFSLSSFTIEVGSGPSSGGSFAAYSLVAPPAAGEMAGEAFEAVAGPVTETAALAPPLRIHFVGGGDAITIAWPKENGLWRLREAPALAGAQAAWTDTTAPYTTNATHVQITVPVSPGCRFYRLEQP